MKLLNAIQTRFPGGFEYSEAIQMCLWLHLRKNTLPSDCGEFAGDKGELAETFSTLAQNGKIREGCNEPTDSSCLREKTCWSNVIESLYKDDVVVDFNFPDQFSDIFTK
jgi:hypothetical protein